MTAEPVVWLVRAREGLVGNTQRSCHVVIAPDCGGTPAFLTACCGARFAPGSVELLDKLAGMPCFLCLMKAPIPGLDRTAIEAAQST